LSYTPVPGGKDRIDRERQDADRRYHQVFAELDRLVNEAAAALPPNDPAAARLAMFQSVLVQFLQQITPYIDTKLRGIEQQVADVAMTAVAAQRTALASARGVRSTSSKGVEPLEPVEHTAASVQAAAYVSFEDLFRGSESEIRARQADYVPLFAGAADVLDAGCGRGEFLQLLNEAGIPARGIDLNAEMVAACRERGLRAEQADVVSYLSSLGDDSLGGLFAAQVVEHLEPRQLQALLREAARVLRPGSRLLLETINPTCWAAFFESYIRDLTHAKPLHPETLKFLVVASGFTDVDVRFRSPIPEESRLRRLPPIPAPPAEAPRDAQLLAQLVDAFNLNMERLNDQMFTHLDYAVIARRA
jgi:O-antigen chain-terminating methyltransferase